MSATYARWPALAYLDFLKIVQPILTTGFSLAILVAVPALAISAPASLAQASSSQTAETPNQTDSPLSSARPPSLIERITAGKRAEEQWRQAVEEDPQNAEAYRNLANALAALNRDRDAEAIYQRAIQLDMKDEAAYLAFGEFLQTRLRLYDVAVLYQQMVKALPESAIAHEQLANSLTRIAPEDWPNLDTEIEVTYRRAVLLNPNQTSSYYGLSAYLARQGRFAEAMSTLREIIRLDPDNEQIYDALAALPTRNKDLTAAAAIYQEGLAAQPNNSELYVNFVSWLLSHDRNAEVEAVYQKALEKMPGNRTLHREFAEYLAETGQLERAIALYQKTIDQNIADGYITYVRLGDILFSQGRNAAAKAAYEQAVLLSPDAYGKLGRFLESTEGIDAAIALYRQAIEQPRVKDKGAFYNQIGRLLQAAGQTDEAIATYRQALSLPDGQNIHNSAEPLAKLLLDQQQYAEALTLYERFQFSFSSDEETLENWQAALRGLGRTAEADTLLQDVQAQRAAASEATYRRAIALSPESGYFYDLLGDSLTQQDKSAAAEVAYQEALRLNFGVFRTRIKLGKALFEQGKLAQAESIYQQALDLFPTKDRQYFAYDQGQLYKYLGELYETTNRPVLALEFYRISLEIDPYQGLVEDKVAELLAKASDNGAANRASTETEAKDAMPKDRD